MQALGAESPSPYEAQVNKVCRLCVPVVAGLSPASDEHADAHRMSLALAALPALTEPRVAVLNNLKPVERSELAAAVAVLVQHLCGDLQLRQHTSPQHAAGAAAAQTRSQELSKCEAATHEDLVACLEALEGLLRADVQEGDDLDGIAAVIQTPRLVPTLTALLRPTGGDDREDAFGLTQLQQLSLNCLELAMAAAAPDIRTQAAALAVEAGALEALVQLLRAASAPQRVLQLLHHLAQWAGPSEDDRGLRPAELRALQTLAGACASDEPILKQFLTSASALVRQTASAAARPLEVGGHRLLLETAAALLHARPDTAPLLLDHPLLEYAFGCLAARQHVQQGDVPGAGGPGSLPGEQEAALRLLHPLLAHAAAPGRTLLDGSPGPLLRGLVEQAADGGYGDQVLLTIALLLEEQPGGLQGDAGSAAPTGLVTSVVENRLCGRPGPWQALLPAASYLLELLLLSDMPGLTAEDGGAPDGPRLELLRCRAPAALTQLLCACAALQRGTEGEAVQEALMDPATAYGVVAAALRVMQGEVEGTTATGAWRLVEAALAVLQPLAPRLPRTQAVAFLSALGEHIRGAGDGAPAPHGAGGWRAEERTAVQGQERGLAVPVGQEGGSEAAAFQPPAPMDSMLLCLAASLANPALEHSNWQALGRRCVWLELHHVG